MSSNRGFAPVEFRNDPASDLNLSLSTNLNANDPEGLFEEQSGVRETQTQTQSQPQQLPSQPRAFIDLGWAAFRVASIEVVGVWAESEDAESGEIPRLRIRGETFDLTHEELAYLQAALRIPPPGVGTHDKHRALIDPNSCLNRAQFGEPIFVLRAQDSLAAELVRDWANKAEATSCPPAKVKEARELADAMDAFPGRKNPD